MDTDESTITRVLAVADWAVEPQAVVAAMSRRAEVEPTIFGLLVPAWLHGLDWAGDPTAAIPCARTQLDTLEHLCADAGLLIGAAWVGDPDPATAAGDVLLGEWPADHILLYTARRGFSAGLKFDLDSRIERITGLSVERRRISQPPVPRRRRGHCAPAIA